MMGAPRRAVPEPRPAIAMTSPSSRGETRGGAAVRPGGGGGVRPGGTSNLWARELGVREKPVEAVRLAVEGVRRHVDLGRAGSRYFLLMAGYGIDAAAIHKGSP